MFCLRNTFQSGYWFLLKLASIKLKRNRVRFTNRRATVIECSLENCSKVRNLPLILMTTPSRIGLWSSIDFTGSIACFNCQKSVGKHCFVYSVKIFGINRKIGGFEVLKTFNKSIKCLLTILVTHVLVTNVN